MMLCVIHLYSNDKYKNNDRPQSTKIGGKKLSRIGDEYGDPYTEREPGNCCLPRLCFLFIRFAVLDIPLDVVKEGHICSCTVSVSHSINRTSYVLILQQ